MFYSIFVHYWVNYKYFISDQNFLNLWCELNQLCHEFDESFPEQYDNKEEIKSFCQAYPYYFIDILPINLIANLFAEYVDKNIDVLLGVVKTLYDNDLTAAYMYANKALKLDESIDVLITKTQEHIKYFS